MIVGALWFRLGLLCIMIPGFLKSDKNDGVTAPNGGAKMRAARKNDPNLPITLPDLNIFQKD